MTIDFFDCPNCGKSLRLGARHCNHCDAVEENDWADPEAAVGFATGGYTEESLEDDEAESTSSRWPQALVVIIISLLILSFVLQAFLPQITF